MRTLLVVACLSLASVASAADGASGAYFKDADGYTLFEQAPVTQYPQAPIVSGPGVGSGGGGGAGNPCTTTALSVQYNAAGSFGCISGATSNGTALTLLTMAANSATVPTIARTGAAAYGFGPGSAANSPFEVIVNNVPKLLFYGSSSNVNLASDIPLTWNSGTNVEGGALDTGITRNGAGIVEANSGTAGTLRDFKARTFLSTGANDTAMETLTGGSITGSGTTGFVSMAGTWNTSGSPIGHLIAITETAKGASSRYFSIKGGAGGATDEFYVQTGGVTIATGQVQGAQFNTTNVNGGAKGADTINAIQYYVQGLSTRYYVTSDFTTANNTNLQVITGLSWTLPATTAITVPFRCDLLYSQATAAVAVSLGVQTDTVTPTYFRSWAVIGTDTTAATAGNASISNTTATSVVTGTPAATATIYSANINGYLENPSNASTTTVNIMIKTATGADAITVKQGSFCTVL